MVLLGTTDRDGNPVVAEFRSVFIKGRERVVAVSLLHQLEGGDAVPEGLECDGCSWSPDRIAGRAIWPACVIHDADYRRGGTWADRWRSDRALRRNIALLLWKQQAPLSLWLTVPWVYWRAVRLAGAGAFAFAPGEEALGWFQRWREILGVFRAKRSTNG